MAYHPLKSKLFAFFLIAWEIHRFFYRVDPLFSLYLFFLRLSLFSFPKEMCVTTLSYHVFPKLLFWHFNETYLHIYIFFLIAKQIENLQSFHTRNTDLQISVANSSRPLGPGWASYYLCAKSFSSNPFSFIDSVLKVTAVIGSVNEWTNSVFLKQNRLFHGRVTNQRR